MLTKIRLENPPEEPCLTPEPVDCCQLATSSDPIAGLIRTAMQAGCRYLVVTSIARSDQRFSDGVVVSNLPMELTRALDRLQWLQASIPQNALRSSFTPMHWQTCRNDLNPLNGDMNAELDLLDNHQMLQGLACPIHEPNGRLVVVIFSGFEHNLIPPVVDELHRAALQAFERLHQLHQQKNTETIGLTSRERDCLYWTAAGKTSSEIGIILAISQHTVNHYLTGAIQKLNAINRTQAVVKALLMQLIEFPQPGKGMWG